MGALRGAELHDFGMRGVGKIFEWYRDGTLEDDDEVAVLHGPKETGYVALSEPMINIRATLQKAADQQIISPATHHTLKDLAKSLFYQQRSWETLFDHPGARAQPAAELNALRAWLPEGRIDLKRNDALAMLSAMSDLRRDDPEPKRVTYHFEWTEMWDDAARISSAAGADPTNDNDVIARERVLDELRLDADAFHQARHSAFLRLLAQWEADRRRLTVDRAALSDAINRFRTKHQLFTRTALDRWVAQNDIDPRSFELLMADEARLEALSSSVEPALDGQLLAELRLSGEFPRLAERARSKQRILTELGLENPEPRDVGATLVELRAWYFESRLGRPMPDDVDHFARELGFTSRTEFDRALVREYLYAKQKELGNPDAV